MSPSIETLFRSFIQCANEQRWDEALAVPGATLRHHGRDEPIPDAIRDLGNLGYTVQLTVDAVTVDEQSQRLGATVVISMQPAGVTSENANTIQVLEHQLMWAEDGKIAKIHAMLDTDDLRRKFADADYRRSAQLDTISSSSSSSGSGHNNQATKLSKGELEEMYKSYIGCINAQTMELDLPRFCHAAVTHNGTTYPLDRYRGLMEAAFAAVPDIVFGLDVFVVDEEAQRVAVRIEFTGTPTGTMAGAEPTGRSVRFCEYVTYHFRDGKIDRVWSIVDWNTYRQQLIGEVK